MSCYWNKGTCYFCGIADIIDTMEMGNIKFDYCGECYLDAMKEAQKYEDEIRYEAEQDNYDKYRY